jgi:hypothetical protein
MPYLLLSGFLLFAAYPLIGTTMAVWVLAGSQLALLVGQIRKGQVSGVGGFIFMSFLFFGVRPIYMVLEEDYGLMLTLFRVRSDLGSVGDAMWWASAGSLCFALGAFVAPKIRRRWLQRRRMASRRQSAQTLVSAKVCYGMMFLQLLTLPVMFALAKSGRSLYGSSLGAYAYDLPVPLQSIHIITVAVLLERYLRSKNTTNLVVLSFSGFLFVDFTWLMREVSIFRGFYVAGVMIAGIAVLQRIKGRVGYAWLIIPILALQPFFQYLGQDRYSKNEELAEAGLVDEVFGKQTLGEAYWNFFDAKGDMNIFDTFVAAKKSEPTWHPYVWSWLYVPLHFVPRAFWPGKPVRGVTMDESYARGAPYSPGIAGLFVLDGGLIWMLCSMALLGFLVSLLDCWVFTLPRGYLQYCLIGIVTVNAMFLTRFFLWQYFYQMLYAMVPCILLARYFGQRGGAARYGSQRALAAAGVSGPAEAPASMISPRG